MLNQSVSARFPLATKVFSYLQPTFKTKFSFDPFSDEHKLYYDSGGDYDEYKTEAEAEKIFNKKLALDEYALFLSVLPAQQTQQIKPIVSVVEAQTERINTIVPVSKAVDLKAISELSAQDLKERLKSHRQSGFMNFIAICVLESCVLHNGCSITIRIINPVAHRVLIYIITVCFVPCSEFKLSHFVFRSFLVFILID